MPDLDSTAGVIQDMRRAGILPEIAEYIDNDVVHALNSQLNAGLRESKGGLLMLRVLAQDLDRMMEILNRWGGDTVQLNQEEWERVYSLRHSRP